MATPDSAPWQSTLPGSTQLPTDHCELLRGLNLCQRFRWFGHPGLFVTETKQGQCEEACAPAVMSSYTLAVSASKSLIFGRTIIWSSADSEIGPFFPHVQWFWSHPQCCSLANLLVSPLFSCPKLLSRTSAQATSGQCTAGWSARRTCAKTCGGISAVARLAETFMQTRCSRRVNEPVLLLRVLHLFVCKSRTSRSEYWNFMSCYNVVDSKAYLIRLETDSTDWIPK